MSTKYTVKNLQSQIVMPPSKIEIRLNPNGGTFSDEELAAVLASDWGKQLIEHKLLIIEAETPAQKDDPANEVAQDDVPAPTPKGKSK